MTYREIRTQQIRESQFVITYGPGAIIEGPRGPRIIPQPNIGLFGATGLRPVDYCIDDARMTLGLLRGTARVFRLPSNAEMQLSDDDILYYTSSFPDWRLCSNARDHGQNCYVLYHGHSCPVCHSAAKETQEPIRFVLACSMGHLDDVDWHNLVHRGGHGCHHTAWFRWHRGGGALSEIELECPTCQAHERLGTAYSQEWPCNGRFPEREPLRSQPIRLGGCNRVARITQRQASNLRIPELRTLFTIPPRDTVLHDVLHLLPIYTILNDRHRSGRDFSSRDELRDALEGLAGLGLIQQQSVDRVVSKEWDEIERAIQVVLSPFPYGTTYQGLLIEEFNALIGASARESRPVYGPPPSTDIIFEVNPNLISRIRGPNNNAFKIVPVSKLRTVTIQTGYRREVDRQVDPNNPANLVEIGFAHPSAPSQLWYPGVQFLGEGIFIMLDENDGWHYALAQDAAAQWQSAFSSHSGYPAYVFRSQSQDSPDELHPVFVWWHTLAHLFIRNVAIEAGYSSASIRERVYVQIEQGRARGAAMLYATQPGSQGTLGGMLALASHFNDIMNQTFENLDNCSGDPLCRQNRFSPGRYNGAACYGCVLVSETSCEHRNMWLDRNVVLENLP